MKNKKLGLLLIFSFTFLFFRAADAQAQEGIIPVIKFKDADIKVVLQSIAEKATKNGKRINIVSSPKVEGFIRVSLENVDWQTALEAVLKTYEYWYIWVGDNIILVDTLENIRAREAQERERQEVETPRLQVFRLKYIDANDARNAVTPLLSPVGRASVLEMTGQAGWEFGSDVTKRARAAEGKVSRTKVLVISDISKKLDEIDKLLAEIDVMPQQVLIKAKIMEVNRDLLKDIGFDWGTGSGGASSSTMSFIDVANDDGVDRKQIAGHILGSKPSIFSAKGESNVTADNTGLKLVVKKLWGSQFEAIIHTLEEDIRTNTLSSPNILTLNNQEASILVGEKYPIVKTEISAENGAILGGSAEYRDIGIQLNVVPQICGEDENFINMIVHPAITSIGSTVSILNADEVVLASYPRITSREAETQIIIRNGEMIVLGGLLKEVKSKGTTGVPVLKDIPLLGKLFRRQSKDTEIVDLLIFLSATIVNPGDAIPEQVVDVTRVTAQFEQRADYYK